MTAKAKTHVSTERSWRLRPSRPTKPDDRPEIVVMNQGAATHVFLGTIKGECIGTLDANQAVELAREILLRRSKPSPSFRGWPDTAWDGPVIRRGATRNRRGAA